MASSSVFRKTGHRPSGCHLDLEHQGWQGPTLLLQEGGPGAGAQQLAGAAVAQQRASCREGDSEHPDS